MHRSKRRTWVSYIDGMQDMELQPDGLARRKIRHLM
jgi:hypothetical protein